MTREEAIEYWKYKYDSAIMHNDIHYDTRECKQHEEYVKALEMAIKALEQQPCDDCISRQAVLDGLASIAKVKARSDAQKSLMGRVMFFVEHLPPVTPKEKIGKWIDDANKIDAQFGRHTYICSECGKYAEYFISGTEVWWDRIKPNFCPNCGARMEVNNEYR